MADTAFDLENLFTFVNFQSIFFKSRLNERSESGIENDYAWLYYYLKIIDIKSSCMGDNSVSSNCSKIPSVFLLRIAKATVIFLWFIFLKHTFCFHFKLKQFPVFLLFPSDSIAVLHKIIKLLIVFFVIDLNDICEIYWPEKGQYLNYSLDTRSSYL